MLTLILVTMFFLLVLAVAGILVLNRRKRAANLFEKERNNCRLDAVVVKPSAKPAQVPVAAQSKLSPNGQFYVPVRGEKVLYRTAAGKLLTARTTDFEYGSSVVRMVHLRRRGHEFMKSVTEVRPRPARVRALIAAA